MSSFNKVVIDLGPDHWHGYATETVWAEKISEDVFKIRNVPFYAKDLSVEDEIMVEHRGENYYSKFIVKRSGHSTYRIFLNERTTADIFRKYWEPLENIGCSYEKGQGRLFAIDVPPSTNINKAYGLLEEGEKNNIWEFEEGHCGHLLDN